METLGYFVDVPLELLLRILRVEEPRIPFQQLPVR